MKTLLLSLFGMVALSTVAVADDVNHHEGHYDIQCSTRNARGQRFYAEGYSEYPHDRYVRNEVQEDATRDCQRSSFICIEEGCTERYHHPH